VYAPVLEGMWKQHELWDGTYTFNDLLDAQEIILVRQENQRRADAWQQTQEELPC